MLDAAIAAGQPRARARAERAAGEGPAARPAWAATTRPSRRSPRASGWPRADRPAPIWTSTRSRLIEPAARLLHRRPPRDRCRAPGCATTCRSRSSSSAFHAPARRWSSRPCRRTRASPPATSCRSSTRSPTIDAADAEQPAQLSRGAGRTVDGRPARGAGRICATIICRRSASSASPSRARAWFTDKMPLNETHLGLIALMFPRSPMIHVLRHPLDVVLSTFSNH